MLEVLNPDSSTELAGAASDTDSEASRQGMPEAQPNDPVARKREILSRIDNLYVEDPDREIGVVSSFKFRNPWYYSGKCSRVFLRL